MRKPPNQPAIQRPGEGQRGEQGHLGYLLRQAGTAFRQRMERALNTLEVTPPQFAVLTMLAAYPGVSNADIARLSMLAPQTVTVIVANLERAGLVARRAHAVHGRIRHIDLTAVGVQLLKRCRGRVNTIEDHIAAGLSRTQEQIIRRWLVRLAVEGGA